MDVDASFLLRRAGRAAGAGYPKAKWIGFCERMLALGYSLSLYEAERSKYVTVFNLGKSFKVRFSNHGATHRGAAESCDFFVGVNSFGTRTTEQAVDAVVEALGPSPFKSLAMEGSNGKLAQGLS